ncbi:AIF_HP2_G0044830.mRNA.1.CDS.1 [Saccharomyces cerevisiae]|nr:AIF_HP2_G0044830.mRNA.1.CDS.1 [Saccharomyces cerevisiae]CAI6729175.1 AIF_HP2_G0044830.mRNA.1.CDS.1 [Saccharomyces cerevisiae]
MLLRLTQPKGSLYQKLTVFIWGTSDDIDNSCTMKQSQKFDPSKTQREKTYSGSHCNVKRQLNRIIEKPLLCKLLYKMENYRYIRSCFTT